jgi:hypothetical protein
MNTSVSVFCYFLFPSAHLQQLILLTRTYVTNRSLTQSKEDMSSDGKYVSVFLLDSGRIRRIKSSRFLSSVKLFVSSNISSLFSFLILAPHSVSFFLTDLILSAQVRMFLFLHCNLLLTVFEAWEMSAKKVTLLHQVLSLSRSASSDSLDIKKLHKFRLLLAQGLVQKHGSGVFLHVHGSQSIQPLSLLRYRAPILLK